MEASEVHEPSEFHTLKGYQLKSEYELTESMEDYLEMIYRCAVKDEYARVGDIASRLNVQPSSASKMIGKLSELDFIKFEKYGIITLSEKGEEVGKYLLWRHNVLYRFFCRLNQSADELTQVEQIEHFVNRRTVENISRLTDQMQKFNAILIEPYCE
jgi:DtxR family Mn-dependent transcriptional regulator